jgi:DNA-binding HxlR family transcriptional regulator
MALPRTYGERCGAAHALDLVGERWGLLVIRELLLGPKRFTDLRRGIPGASPNVLSQRLRELEGIGIVERRKLPPPAASQVYELTEWGYELEPAMLALGAFGARSPHRDMEGHMSVDSFVLAMKALFDPAEAGDFEIVAALTIDDDEFTVRIGDGALAVTRGLPADPDAALATTADSLTGLLWEGRSLADAERAGEATAGGDRKALRRYLGLFPRPDLAPAPV